MDAEGNVHGSAKYYWVALNSAQRAISRFATHMASKSGTDMDIVTMMRAAENDRD